MSADTDRAVVVTGAASGIGRACALHLDRQGFRVLAAVRRPAEIDGLAREASRRLVPLTLELLQPASVADLPERVADELGTGSLSGLVNCAGGALFAPLEFVPLDALRRQLEVNVVGPLAVIQALLPMLRRGRGRIVNLGSISGLVAPPFLGPYAASEFALEALSDSLRRELLSSGVHVALIEAGRIDTPIWGKTASAFDELRASFPEAAESHYGAVLDLLRGSAERGGGLAAEAVARVVEVALVSRRPRTRYVVGKDARTRSRLRWLPDRLQDWMLTRRLPRPEA